MENTQRVRNTAAQTALDAGIKCALVLMLTGSTGWAQGLCEWPHIGTKIVSLDSNCAASNDDSHHPRVSSDGRYVVFESAASNLVASDTNSATDVFLRDTLLNTTTRISVTASGQETQGGPFDLPNSTHPSISGDGTLVVFDSLATNLVSPAPPLVNNRVIKQVYLKNLVTGSVVLVSVPSWTPGLWADGDSDEPEISSDGAYVAFGSVATNLIINDTNGYKDVFRYQSNNGNIIRVSQSYTPHNLPPAIVQANNNSFMPSISSDGRYIAFISLASSLLPSTVTMSSGRNVFVRDTTVNPVRIVSTDTTGTVGANMDCSYPAISGDGGSIAFVSYATNLVGAIYPPSNLNQAYFRTLGATLGATQLLSYDPILGTACNEGVREPPSISTTGQWVTFASSNANFVGGDTNGLCDVFLYDTTSASMTRVGLNYVQAEATGGDSTASSMTADGNMLVFQSDATNLVVGDANGKTDIFRREIHPLYFPYCIDGTTSPPCPCGNTGDLGYGCGNSIHASGGLIVAAGTASVSADTLVLTVSSLPTSTDVLFYQGGAQYLGVFGDGRRCVGGQVIRFGTKTTTNGVASYPEAADVPVSIIGLIPAAGGTRYYQGWYRNADPAFCTPETFNLTNAIQIIWVP
jgi:Tol biopolymer transport system component